MRCVPTATTCGHAMHSKCFQKFYDSLLESERNNLFRSVNVNVNWQEFICPACQRLCNSVAPLMPGMAINCLIIINLPICTYFCMYFYYVFQSIIRELKCYLHCDRFIGLSNAGFFSTPPAKKTKAQGQKSRKKLNLWEDFPSHV